MQGPNAVLNVMTIPPGAGLGQRIVIDGFRGAIFEYSSTNALDGSWASKAGTDPYGNIYPQGFSINVGVISGITIDGAIINGSVIEGSDTILNQQGLFVYSSDP